MGVISYGTFSVICPVMSVMMFWCVQNWLFTSPQYEKKSIYFCVRKLANNETTPASRLRAQQDFTENIFVGFNGLFLGYWAAFSLIYLPNKTLLQLTRKHSLATRYTFQMNTCFFLATSRSICSFLPRTYKGFSNLPSQLQQSDLAEIVSASFLRVQGRFTKKKFNHLFPVRPKRLIREKSGEKVMMLYRLS